jgi:hypothetical protein
VHIADELRTEPARVTESYVRKAVTRLPDGRFVERDWTPSERYKLYVRGFRDGASIKAMRETPIPLRSRHPGTV